MQLIVTGGGARASQAKPRSSRRNLVRTQVAADRYGVCSKTIRNYIARGDLQAFRLGPRLIFVDQDEVEALFRPITTTGTDAGQVA